MIHSTSTFSFYNLPPQYSSLSLAPHVSLRRVVTINNTRQNSATGSIPKLLKTRKININYVNGIKMPKVNLTMIVIKKH